MTSDCGRKFPLMRQKSCSFRGAALWNSLLSKCIQQRNLYKEHFIALLLDVHYGIFYYFTHFVNRFFFLSRVLSVATIVIILRHYFFYFVLYFLHSVCS